MTVCFVGGFGRNAHRVIQVPERWETVLLDSITDLPDEPFVLVAGLGSRLTVEVIKAQGSISYCILVKPFAFEGKDAQAVRILSLIPAGCEIHVFDNQKLADQNSKQGIADFQKTLFGQIEATLHGIESKLQYLPVLE
jgi:hypothetical protein